MTTVIAIAVVEHAGRVLVGVRPAGGRFGGFHEFPGGKTDAGESPEAASVRECLEETGLQVQTIGRLIAVEDATANLQLHFVACRLIDDLHPPAPPFRWIALGELAQCRFPPANACVVERLLAKGRTFQ